MKPLLFTEADVIRATDEWGFNCGPGALCAVLGKTPDELRPAMLDFESKGYTNPTLMFNVLKGLDVRHRLPYRGDHPNVRFGYTSMGPSRRTYQFPELPDYEYVFPELGLMRVQWSGPWTKPGVPMAARYRHTHWVGVLHEEHRPLTIFDINAMCVGGWIGFEKWRCDLVPWLVEECVENGDGQWWPTHVIEILGTAE